MTCYITNRLKNTLDPRKVNQADPKQKDELKSRDLQERIRYTSVHGILHAGTEGFILYSTVLTQIGYSEQLFLESHVLLEVLTA